MSEAFDAKKYRERMMATGLAEFGCNFFWQDIVYSCSPTILVNQNAIYGLRDRDFEQPCEFPEKLIIAVEAMDKDISQTKGAWKRCNAEEMIHAYVLAIARDVQKPAAAQTLKRWRFHCLQTTTSFEVQPSDQDIFWRNANLRENTAQAFQAVVRTAVQRIFEITRFASRTGGSMSTASIHKLYNDRLRQSNISMDAAARPSTECVTLNFIQNALKLSRAAGSSLFTIPACKEVIMWAEAEFAHDSPFNGVARLVSIQNNCKTPGQMIFVMKCIQDRYRAKIWVGPQHCSEDNLQGKGSSAKGWVHLFQYKQQLLTTLLGPKLDELPFAAEVKTRLRECFSSHSSYRNQLKPYGNNKVDLAWLAALNDPAQTYTTFIEDTGRALQRSEGGRECIAHKTRPRETETPAESRERQRGAKRSERLGERQSEILRGHIDVAVPSAGAAAKTPEGHRQRTPMGSGPNTFGRDRQE